MSKQHQITSHWKGKMAFDSIVQGHTIRTDNTKPDGDASGPTPKPLLLASLAGCTGLDVALVLGKMRVDIDDLKIDVTAELTDTEPSLYSSIKVIYYFKAQDLESKKEKIQRAVSLSMDKLCGVTQMLRQVCPVDYEIQWATD